jgi:allophanate hydrolase subunit 2
VTGAPAAVSIDGRSVAWGAAVDVRAGARLEVGPASAGLRSYVSFAGGVCAEEVLGSRSHDVLSGLGPKPLRNGDQLPLGAAPDSRPPAVDVAPQPAPPGELTTRAQRPSGPRRGPSRPRATASDCGSKARRSRSPPARNSAAKGS